MDRKFQIPLLILFLVLGNNYINSEAVIKLNQVPGEDASNAIPLMPGDHYLDAMPGPSSSNGYWFVYDLGTAYQSGDYQFRITVENPTGTNFDLRIYDTDLNFVDEAFSFNNPEFVQIKSIQAIHYVHAVPTSGSGNFDFEVIDFGLRGDDPANGMYLRLNEPLIGILPGPASDESMYYEVDFGYIAGVTMYTSSL
ncbi:MAG: hypothetical protein IH840_11020, partial [Candidatus Heimdallarchaeota archaeon]|nr:hypothetical protein [Candidatus Heimdallarchaeota archaeon]